MALVNSTIYTLKNTHSKISRLRGRTDGAWFSRLVRHPVRKQSGSIITTPEPTRGKHTWETSVLLVGQARPHIKGAGPERVSSGSATPLYQGGGARASPTSYMRAHCMSNNIQTLRGDQMIYEETNADARVLLTVANSLVQCPGDKHHPGNWVNSALCRDPCVCIKPFK